VQVNVLAFARLRELFGFSSQSRALPRGATLATLWEQLVAERPDAAAMRASTRFARNGILVEDTTALSEGDEIALMPPVGGG